MSPNGTAEDAARASTEGVAWAAWSRADPKTRAAKILSNHPATIWSFLVATGQLEEDRWLAARIHRGASDGSMLAYQFSRLCQFGA